MRKRSHNWSTESSTARGYGYAWQQLRLHILERDCYLCQCSECKLAGRLKSATEVNHVVSKADAKRKGWTQAQVDDASNLQAVNHDCHERITLEQRGVKVRPVTGSDGWPVAAT